MSEPHTVVDQKDVTYPPVVDGTKFCPCCRASWEGPAIPEANRPLFYGNHTHFSLLVGIEIRGRYDGIHHWMCPSCKTTFPRWLEDAKGNPTFRMFNDDLHSKVIES